MLGFVKEGPSLQDLGGFVVLRAANDGAERGDRLARGGSSWWILKGDRFVPDVHPLERGERPMGWEAQNLQ